jgi:chemotaxis receptor (MCP) glutamine deamidase CheD
MVIYIHQDIGRRCMMRELDSTGYFLSDHLLKRMNQRGIRKEDLTFALMNGARKLMNRAIHIFVGKRHVDREHDSLNGLRLVVVRNVVITAYKNKNARWNWS